MPAVDISNPAVIRFLNESYEKTAYLRMRWNFLNKDKLQETATLHREEKGYYVTDVIKESMAAGMITITRDHHTGARNRRKPPIRDAIHVVALADLKKGHSIVDVGLGDTKEDPRLGRPDTDLTVDPIMRPVDPNHKKIIYKFGSQVYLKTRNKIAAEDKYYFRQSSGLEYGWRLKDSFFGRHQPEYGCVYHLTRDSMSRSGPQPDPDYYAEVGIPGPNKCH